MLPSLVAKDIQEGLRQFLTTGFEASDDFMSGIMARFVKDPAGWLKGPYLQLGLQTWRGDQRLSAAPGPSGQGLGSSLC